MKRMLLIKRRRRVRRLNIKKSQSNRTPETDKTRGSFNFCLISAGLTDPFNG